MSIVESSSLKRAPWPPWPPWPHLASHLPCNADLPSWPLYTDFNRSNGSIELADFPALALYIL